MNKDRQVITQSHYPKSFSHDNHFEFINLMWRKNHYFPPTNDPPAGMMQKVKYIGRGQIKDKVKVPDVEVGTYVVSWRWDCEASPQVWSGCSNVEIVA